MTANSTEDVTLPTGTHIFVPKCATNFELWKGAPISDDYNGKPVLTLDSVPLFAELVALRLLEKDGWKGLWVDGFGGKTKYRIDLPEKAEPTNLQLLAPDQFSFLARIREKAGREGGCFDVFVWRGNERRFVELKRSGGRDRVRLPMKHWLAAALQCGVKTTDMLVVEWNVR